MLLGDVGRGVAGLRVLDEVTAERILGLQVVGDRRPVPERLGHLDPVAGAVEGEGGTADDLHVPEPQGGQVVRGHLAAHRQGARAVQDRAGEPLDRRLHRLQRRRVPVQRELRPAGEHQERDREALEELGGAQQLPLELRPEGIGQRQDEPVVLIVDLRGHTGVDAVVVRIHDRVRRREQLVGRRTVDQVPAVGAQQVPFESEEGIDDVERCLAEPHQVARGHRVPVVANMARATRGGDARRSRSRRLPGRHGGRREAGGECAVHTAAPRSRPVGPPA